ncbi:hypothetical protein MKEN_00752900 [Mycena kentingensis (nom. inval.)]|nr:hypothetical protein MKEN_00752900 [Mycena kentingensis (nom. inval.)]
MPQYSVDSVVFDSVASGVNKQLAAACASAAIHGIFLILFVLGVTSLRNHTTARKLLLRASWVFYTCATYWVQGRPWDTEFAVYEWLVMVEGLLFAVNNALADTFFLYRCFIIWNRQKLVLIPPFLAIAATLVTGILASVLNPNRIVIFDINPDVPYGLGLGTNLLLLILIGGRLWRARGEAGHLQAHRVHVELWSRYTFALSVVIESGAVYLAAAAFLIAAGEGADNPQGTAYQVAFGITQQVINIAPMMTVVRVGMRHNGWRTLSIGKDDGHSDPRSGPNKDVNIQPQRDASPELELSERPFASCPTDSFLV